MKKFSLGFLTILFLFFSGAGQASPQLKAHVVMFSAPWCLICKAKLPTLLSELEKLEEAQPGSFDVTVYIETGELPGTLPTATDASAFQQHLGTGFPVLPDPKWALYGRYYSAFFLPGVVVLDGAGNILKVFSSAFGLHGEDVVALVSDQLQGN